MEPLPPLLPKRPKRPTKIEVVQHLHVGQRISISLIALSLSLFSLALGLAFISSPAPFLVVAPDVTITTVPTSATAVTLSWTAPGDDGDVGQAAAYELRYSSAPLNDANFALATQATGLTSPQPAGSTESFTVTNLNPATTYFFGLKTQDEAGNVSALSNITSQTTAAAALACNPTYQCSAWSICVDGQQSRTCSVTNNCPAGLDQPITQQACSGSGGAVTLRNPILVAGVGPGTIPVIRTVDPTTGKPLREILTFSRSNKLGTNVAAGDVNGDGNADVLVGSGGGADSLVKLFTTGGKLVTEFRPYPASLKAGAQVAVDDLDGNGIDEVLTLPSRGAAQVRVFRYSTTTKRFESVAQMFAYPQTSRNGFTFGTGDLNLDGRSEIVVAPRTNGRTVVAYAYGNDQKFTRLAKFSPYPVLFTSGVRVAVGDTNGDGRGEIITTPGPGYYSHVKVFTLNGKLQSEFRPASSSYRGGVDLTAYDTNKDGREEILTGSYSAGDPGVRVFRYNGLTRRFALIKSYFVYPRTMQSGLRLDAAPSI